MQRVVDIAGLSDTGLIRERNEDCLLVVDLDSSSALDLSSAQRSSGERGPLLIVCDGMGGMAGGDVASKLACEVISKEMQAAVRTDKRAVLARSLRRAVRKANQEIWAAASADKSLKGMGTTVSAAAIVGNTAVLAQVGDSRAYVLRYGKLTQITRDQSVVGALVQAGKMSEQQAQYSMQRGRILQALGSTKDVEVSLSIAELRAGDRLLLCSDGLHGFLSDEVIAEACGGEGLELVVARLVELANAAGGSDNVTVLLAEISGEGMRAPVAGEDALRFTEIDYALDGDSALSTTSIVGRRLAHKAGLRGDSSPKRIPSTAQHPVVGTDVVAEQSGPAEQKLKETSKFRLGHYLGVACLAAAGILYLLFWL